MVNKKKVLQLTSRFIAYVFLVATIITVSVLTHEYGPSPTLYGDDDWKDADKVSPPGYNETQYKAVMDDHSHTIYSDGSLSVKQNIEWHISMGFNVIVISDHNTLDNKDDIEELQKEYERDDVLIIQGMEWTTNRIHMNIIGLSEWDLDIPSDPSDDDIKEAIKEAHRQDAIAVCNHILWSVNEARMDDHPSREDLLEWDIDFIEVINGDTASKNSYDEESVEFCEDHGLGQITGTDMHAPDYAMVNAWTLLNVSELTEDAVISELKDGRTKILVSNVSYGDQGKHKANPWYLVVQPLDKLGGLFSALWIGNGLDWFGVLVYIMFFLIIFALVEVYRYIKLKFWERINQRRNKTQPKSQQLP